MNIMEVIVSMQKFKTFLKVYFLTWKHKNFCFFKFQVLRGHHM